ncbi:hypothetical protein [Acinetobacter towneri]|uniref:hypothetical protein n=1 Tax=Acinetobacter towneri TaxID=202956 RepID=UPI001F61725F|nr:hypothetical protein [Acinetobacter towneri]UNT60688.1 hypothetical protein IHE36_06845 [Acinetobacter towneri]
MIFRVKCLRGLDILTPLIKNVRYGKIKGTTKQQGAIYPFCKVSLFDKRTAKLIAETTSSENGEYIFSGVPHGMIFFVMAFDNKKQFNAVIQDNVVPK